MMKLLLMITIYLYSALAAGSLLGQSNQKAIPFKPASFGTGSTVQQDTIKKPRKIKVHADWIRSDEKFEGTKPVEPPHTPAAQVNRNGPDKNGALEWKNYIGGDYPFSSSYPLVNIYAQMYADKNLQSGYYYYLPNSYNLSWSPVSGYALFIKFLSNTSGGKGEATVTAELSPNITNRDLSIAGELINANLLETTTSTSPESLILVAAPLAGPPRVSIDQISSFGINPNDISVTRPSNLAEPIRISWKMSNIENLMTALFENIGLSGNLFLQPIGDGMPEISIPFNIKLNEQQTFGKFEMDPQTWRTAPWVNSTPYPIVLKNVHVMKSKTSEAKPLTVYTWQAGNIEVPPGASAVLDASLVPAWIDHHESTQRIWLDYDVKACNFCDDEIQNKLVGGATETRMRMISFNVFDPLAYTGARMIKIKIRSVQADPNTRSKIDLPTLTILSDDISLEGGVLYVPESSEPEFEYFLQLIMSDGTIYESDYWEVSKDPGTNVIGQALIKRMVKSFRK